MEVYLVLAAIIIGIFALGSIIGSFLNVVALRGLSGESIVLPPSKCPKCENKLKPWHNIPILSYLFLRGKCAYCHEKISIQYPIVEAIAGILAVATFFKFQLALSAIFIYTILCILLVMSVTDIREKVILTGHAWALIIVSLLSNIAGSIFILIKLHENSKLEFSRDLLFNLPVIDALLGLILGVAIMEALAGIGHLIVKRRAFGVGDTFIAAGLGALFGAKGLILALILSIAIQVTLFIPKFFQKLARQKDFQTIGALTSFIVLAVASSYILYNHYTTTVQQLLLLLPLAGTGIWSCVRIILNLKQENETESITVMPFGPAMAIAAVIVLFFI